MHFTVEFFTAAISALLLTLDVTNILLFLVVGLLSAISFFLFTQVKNKKVMINQLQGTIDEHEANSSQQKNELSEIYGQLEDLRNVIIYQKEEFSKQEKKNKTLEEKLGNEIFNTTRELSEKLDKAHASNKLKEAFLEKISREIRTPLNSILGFINLLNDTNLSKIDRDYYFKFIRESGNNLLALIDNIVDFTKIETGEMQIEEMQCHLNLLISDLIDKYRSKILRENSTLAIVYNNNISPNQCLIDCKRAIYIIDQIINNAVKFTKEGKIEVNYNIENNKHKIEVNDTGIGFDIEQKDKIFERFFQIEPENQEVFQGAGLGLTIAKGVAELLGGNIDVASEINKGSKFTIELPYKPIPASSVKGVLKGKNYNWKDKVILIAEDEDSNYFFLEAILKRTNAQILRANDGIKFLEIIDTNQSIDLVLLDIKMPGINGFNAIKVIRQQNINVPVIAQTAFNQPEDKQKCLESGCNDYLAKPIDRELLLAKISYFLNP